MLLSYFVIQEIQCNLTNIQSGNPFFIVFLYTILSMDIREIVLQHFLGKVMLAKNCFFCLYLTFSFASNSGMSMIATKD